VKRPPIAGRDPTGTPPRTRPGAALAATRAPATDPAHGGSLGSIVTTAIAPAPAKDPAPGAGHAARPVLALHGVGKTYPNGKVALRDIDLVLAEGEFVFLVGPSGAGKSTLLRLLIRDELPSAGELSVDGRDLARVPRRKVPELRRKIGVVFQDYKLLPTRTVRENVAFALEVTGTPRRRIRPAVDRALAVVGLGDAADQLPTTLSGGEQQRTAIARALVHEPRLIIADEPTGNLDPLISWEIIQLLLRINELGVTVLMATHNADVVTSLRRRVVALDEGRIVRDGVGGYHRED